MTSLPISRRQHWEFSKELEESQKKFWKCSLREKSPCYDILLQPFDYLQRPTVSEQNNNGYMMGLINFMEVPVAVLFGLSCKSFFGAHGSERVVWNSGGKWKWSSGAMGGPSGLEAFSIMLEIFEMSFTWVRGDFCWKPLEGKFLNAQEVTMRPPGPGYKNIELVQVLGDDWCLERFSITHYCRSCKFRYGLVGNDYHAPNGGVVWTRCDSKDPWCSNMAKNWELPT